MPARRRCIRPPALLVAWFAVAVVASPVVALLIKLDAGAALGLDAGAFLALLTGFFRIWLAGTLAGAAVAAFVWRRRRRARPAAPHARAQTPGRGSRSLAYTRAR